jgi:hypothetical protein
MDKRLELKKKLQDIDKKMDQEEKEYFKEIEKRHLISYLDSIRFMADSLQKAISGQTSFDLESKKTIKNLYEQTSFVYNQECSKIMKKQKAAGKKFISNEDIDDLFKEIAENLGK